MANGLPLPRLPAPPDIHAHRILILDFGAQYTQLIARRVRESGVYCEIHPWDMSDDDVRAFGARGIILSGGPESVTDVDSRRVAPQAVFELGVPVLGICYGMQTMAQQLGGRVTAGTASRVRLRAGHGVGAVPAAGWLARSQRRARAGRCSMSG